MKERVSLVKPFDKKQLTILLGFIILCIVLTAFGNIWLNRWKTARQADQETAQFTGDLSPLEIHDRSHIAVFRVMYRNAHVNHALSEDDLRTALSLIIGPNKEAEYTRLLIAGFLADCSNSQTPYLSEKQKVEVALACKPLLQDSWPALRELECTFLYRAGLPEAEADILPLTQDPDPVVRRHAMGLLKKMGAEERSTSNRV